jgi:hypothetical protein
LVRDRFRFRFFFLLFFSKCAKLPPFFVSCGPIFIGKMLLRPRNWSLNFLLFFLQI